MLLFPLSQMKEALFFSHPSCSVCLFSFFFQQHKVSSFVLSLSPLPLRPLSLSLAFWHPSPLYQKLNHVAGCWSGLSGPRLNSHTVSVLVTEWFPKEPIRNWRKFSSLKTIITVPEPWCEISTFKWNMWLKTDWIFDIEMTVRSVICRWIVIIVLWNDRS